MFLAVNLTSQVVVSRVEDPEVLEVIPAAFQLQDDLLCIQNRVGAAGHVANVYQELVLDLQHLIAVLGKSVPLATVRKELKRK